MVITVLPAKCDSGIMICYKVIRDLELIGHLCINHNTQVIDLSIRVSSRGAYQLMLYFFTWNCKQNIMSLLLLVGTTVGDPLQK